MNATKRWLATARSASGPAGVLLSLMRRDPSVPDFHSVAQMRVYLRRKGAPNEALAGLPIVWERYRNWVERHGPATAVRRRRSDAPR